MYRSHPMYQESIHINWDTATIWRNTKINRGTTCLLLRIGLLNSVIKENVVRCFHAFLLILMHNVISRHARMIPYYMNIIVMDYFTLSLLQKRFQLADNKKRRIADLISQQGIKFSFLFWYFKICINIIFHEICIYVHYKTPVKLFVKAELHSISFTNTFRYVKKTCVLHILSYDNFIVSTICV